MLGSIQQFFSSQNFMPHGHCFLWRSDILWVRIISDGIIALAYFTIPVALLYFIRKRRDIGFSSIFILFAVFILGCGATHVMDIWTVWYPQYGLENLVKALTAIASVSTSIVLWRLIPKALKLPSPNQLNELNANLQTEIEERMQVEAELRDLNTHLEDRVNDRTLEIERNNEKLQESQRRFEELVNTIDGIVWEANVGVSPYTFVSGQAEKILGYPAERWVNESGFWQRILHPEDLKKVTGIAYMEPSQKKGRHTEYRVIAADGRIIWVNDFVTVIYKDGHPSQLRGIMVDITERKKVEERLTLALDTSQMGTWDLDLINGSSIRSLRHDQIFGYSSPLLEWNEAIFFEHVISEDREKAKKSFERAYDTGYFDIECRIAWPDKSIHWITARGAVYQRDFKDKPLRIAGIVMDVSEIKRAQQAALEAANLKSEFLANMSHEIRTPLNAIIGMSALVLDSKLSKAQKNDVTMIKRSGDALLVLINDVLDFSKIEAGKLELELSDFDLNGLLSDALEIVSLKAKEKKLRVSTRIAPDIPHELRGDPGRLLQIFINLLSNAVKFTDNGSIEMRVSKHASTNECQVFRFEVSDSGIGMSEQTKKQLFHPFSQGDGSTARKYGGTGLGLSICKRLVELMGGTIGVDSVEKQGSTFWCNIPLEKALNNVAEIPSEAVIEKLPEKKRSKRILIAEDNAANQIIALRFFEKLGHKAEVVASGLEALRAIEMKSYDIIFMDCQMPEMDGYQATREIRKLEGSKKIKVPIIALTAHALNGDRTKCLECGMDDYISKPVTFSVLEKTLDKWTSKPAELAFDEKILKSYFSLQMKGKPDIVQELVKIFHQTGRERMNKMQELLSHRKIEELSCEAHTLKSTCKSVGAMAMSAICDQLEALKHPSSAEQGSKLLELLQEEFMRAKTALVAAVADQKSMPAKKKSA